MPFTPSAAEQSWATQFLQYLGITPTATNVAQVSAWEQAESGGVGSYNNPLNTTLHEPGSWGVNYNNGYPVQGYPTVAEGIQADATALQGNFSHYANIIADLQSGDAPNAQFAGDIAASPWGTGTLVGNVLESGTAPSATLTTAPSPGGIIGEAVGGIAGLAGGVSGVTNGITGDIAGEVTSGIKSAVTGLVGPVVKPAESLAVRVGLVLFGAVAVLVGVATMVKGDSGRSQLQQIASGAGLSSSGGGGSGGPSKSKGGGSSGGGRSAPSKASPRPSGGAPSSKGGGSGPGKAVPKAVAADAEDAAVVA